jgi:hypothetical protein
MLLASAVLDASQLRATSASSQRIESATRRRPGNGHTRGGMKTLFVTPNAYGSGEAITALQMGRELARSGHEVLYFAESFTAPFLAESFPAQVYEFSNDPAETGRRWHSLLQDFHPSAIIFADYPLLFLTQRGRMLVQDENWTSVENLDAELFTLDHLGMANGPMTLSFGPPHLELFRQYLPALPGRMKTLLPCPLQSPTSTSVIAGVSFRYWEVPFALSYGRRQEIRDRFLRNGDELLVFHSVPTWASEFCRRHRLPNYAYATRLFESYFAHVGRPVVIVSVNGESLLPPSSVSGLRVINLGRLTTSEYDEILLASDLMLTDNRISISLGKAVCGLVPCVALRNSYRLPEIVERAERDLGVVALEMERRRAGSVFPFEVFPIWTIDDVNALGLFTENPIGRCIDVLEMYGGAETRNRLEQLLVGRTYREELRARQHDYVSIIQRLPTSGEALLSSMQ